MPSRRQIREAAVQFLYCADLEGGADPAALRDAFWEFVTQSDRRRLQVATFRTVHHLAHGREGRLAEFLTRHEAAAAMLAAWPEAEPLKRELARIAEMEAKWSGMLDRLQRLPREDDDATVARQFNAALEEFFANDRALAAARRRFLEGIDDFPKLRGALEAVAASIRRLQRVSDRLRMVEDPEKFPEQTDLEKLRSSKKFLRELRAGTDRLVDAVLAHKEGIDAMLAGVVEHYAPERIDPVDRAILRLASYEILHGDTPPKVAVNEAVELAKRFGTSDSGRFVNGVLDRVMRSNAGVSPQE
ncbi:MAG: transcription antitermination factor NusB [Luteolibacter sp.]